MLGNHVRPVENAPFNVIACRMLSIERSRSSPIEVCASLLVHDGLEVAAADRFSLKQRLAPAMSAVFLSAKKPFHTLVLLIDDSAHFAVDLAGGLLQ